MAETEQQLSCYADFCRDALAMPVVKGRKTDKESLPALRPPIPSRA